MILFFFYIIAFSCNSDQVKCWKFGALLKRFEYLNCLILNGMRIRDGKFGAFSKNFLKGRLSAGWVPSRTITRTTTECALRYKSGFFLFFFFIIEMKLVSLAYNVIEMSKQTPPPVSILLFAFPIKLWAFNESFLWICLMELIHIIFIISACNRGRTERAPQNRHDHSGLSHHRESWQGTKQEMNGAIRQFRERVD